MNFSQLQCFVALAETGSFTEAAYSVNLTQSAVSHSLSALENELSVTLIERNRKGVVALTSVGRKIMPRVRALLAQAEAIEQEAKVEHGLAMGRLRLGSIETIINPNLLACILTRFQQQYPDIEVVLFEGTMQEVGEWIEGDVIDVGFMLQAPRLMESTLITTDELCVLVAAKHPLNTQQTVAPDDLRDEGWIMAKNRCSLKFLEMAGIEQSRPRIRYQASDNATIVAMVREGLGISLMPRTTLPQKLEGVATLSFDPPQQIEIVLALRSRETASPGARLFVEAAQVWAQELKKNFAKAR